MKPLVTCALFALGALSIATGVSGSIPSTTGAHLADVRGHPLYYEVRGSGRPLLLLHGGGASVSSSFSRQLDAFSATHKIIAPEQVGQGHSPAIHGPLSYTEMMEDTAALLQQLKVEDVDVVGWSDGGILALMLAVKYPQLVHSIVISGTNISPDGLIDAADSSAVATTFKTTLVTTLEKTLDTNPKTAAASRENTEEKLQQLWRSAPTVHELNLTLLQQLHKPVLVLAGDHDVIKLDHTLQIYRALPHAQLSVLPDTGHATFTQRPEWINPMVLRFLATN